MSRQSFFRILLSLLLLVSQQMAFAHGLIHLAGTLHEPPPRQHAEHDSSLSAARGAGPVLRPLPGAGPAWRAAGQHATAPSSAGDNGATAFISTDAGIALRRHRLRLQPARPASSLTATAFTSSHGGRIGRPGVLACQHCLLEVSP